MSSVGRVIAALFSVAFAVLAIPFLGLTTVHILGGDVIGTGTLLTFVAYVTGLIVVVLFWVRRLPRR